MHAVTFGRRQSDVDKHGIELPVTLRHRLPARAAFMGWMSTVVVVRCARRHRRAASFTVPEGVVCGSSICTPRRPPP